MSGVSIFRKRRAKRVRGEETMIERVVVLAKQYFVWPHCMPLCAIEARNLEQSCREARDLTVAVSRI